MKGWQRKAALAAVALGVVIAIAVPALAQKKFLEKVRRQYLLDPAIGKCTLCHKLGKNEDPTKENLNPFGKAIQGHADAQPAMGKGDEHKFTEDEIAAVLKAVAALEGEDSDGDGATNKEEMDLNSNPGDEKSTPDKRKLDELRAKKK